MWKRDGLTSKRRQPLPASRVAYAGRVAGSCCHRDAIWECRLSVELEYMGIPGGDGIYLPCGSYHLGEDGVLRIMCDRTISRQAIGTHVPLCGTRGGTAGGEGRGEAMGGTKNGTTAIEAIVPCHMWWTMRGSNPRPSNCKSAALATELMARIGGIYNIPAWRRERNREIPSP